MDRSSTHQRLPPWFKVRLPGGPNYLSMQRLLREHRLHTVCEEAHCPNIGECFESGTTTFLILGNTCTRRCGFCAVGSGHPLPPDPNEPEHVARSVQRLGLKYAVITSVTRDDLSDGGAGVFAQSIRRIRELVPGCGIEVLIPDLRGSAEALALVMAAGPDVLNHNIETVPRLYPRVRPRAVYGRSLEVLSRAKSPSTKPALSLPKGSPRTESPTRSESPDPVGIPPRDDIVLLSLGSRTDMISLPQGSRTGQAPSPSSGQVLAPDVFTKSGLMVGLGESRDELRQTLADLRGVGCDLLTIGQYLRPSPAHLPVERFYTPEEFRELRDEGLALGFRHVESGPLVRSSYHAARAFTSP